MLLADNSMKSSLLEGVAYKDKACYVMSHLWRRQTLTYIPDKV